MASGQHAAIISGGLGDIGRAIALELARRGANIAVGDLHPAANAKPFLAELRGLGVKARYDRVNVTDAAAVSRWIIAAEAALGTVDWLIPNAAVVTSGGAMAMPPAAWRRELDINLTGAFLMAQAAARRLIQRELPGRIVFLGSWAGHAAHPGIPAYSAAKAGLRMLMKCLALELSEYGILVNEVAPGYVDAGLSGRWFERNPIDRERARRRVPIQSLISAHDVALQVAHLCDPANTQMTGSVLVMDGGLSLVTTAYGGVKQPVRKASTTNRATRRPGKGAAK